MSEFQRLLSRPGFLLLTRRLESTLVPDLRRLTLPRASVYVVDALGHRPATEALVTSLLERFPNARLLVVSEKFSEVNSFPLLRLGLETEVPARLRRKPVERALVPLRTARFFRRPADANIVQSRQTNSYAELSVDETD